MNSAKQLPRQRFFQSRTKLFHRATLVNLLTKMDGTNLFDSTVTDEAREGSYYNIQEMTANCQRTASVLESLKVNEENRFSWSYQIQELMRKTVILAFISILVLSCNDQQEITAEVRAQIIEELKDIKVSDQKYAGIPPDELMEEHGREQAWKIFKSQRDSVWRINQGRIKSLYEKYGYLGYEQVGEEASSDFWISIQHADNDVPFQQEILAALKKEIEKGNADRAEYALLEDRVNVNLGQPQRFGSQLTYNEDGQAIPKIGLVDSANIERLRSEYDLDSFKEYYNSMTRMHFEMNKQFYLEKGITEPKLYE